MNNNKGGTDSITMHQKTVMSGSTGEVGTVGGRFIYTEAQGRSDILYG